MLKFKKVALAVAFKSHPWTWVAILGFKTGRYPSVQSTSALYDYHSSIFFLTKWLKWVPAETNTDLTEPKDRVKHAGPLSPPLAQHRTHWTKWHKAKQMPKTIRLLRCRNINDYSKGSEWIFRSMFQTWPHNQCLVLAVSFWRIILFSCWASRHRGTHSRGSWDLKPPLRPACSWATAMSQIRFNHYDHRIIYVYLIVKVIGRDYAQIFW